MKNRIIQIPVDKSQSSVGYVEWLAENTNWPTIIGLGSTPSIAGGRHITIPVWTAIIGRHVRGGGGSDVTLYALNYNQNDVSQLLHPGDVFICARMGDLGSDDKLLLGNGQVIGGSVQLRDGVLSDYSKQDTINRIVSISTTSSNTSTHDSGSTLVIPLPVTLRESSLTPLSTPNTSVVEQSLRTVLEHFRRNIAHLLDKAAVLSGFMEQHHGNRIITTPGVFGPIVIPIGVKCVRIYACAGGGSTDPTACGGENRAYGANGESIYGVPLFSCSADGMRISGSIGGAGVGNGGTGGNTVLNCEGTFDNVALTLRGGSAGVIPSPPSGYFPGGHGLGAAPGRAPAGGCVLIEW